MSNSSKQAKKGQRLKNVKEGLSLGWSIFLTIVAIIAALACFALIVRLLLWFTGA